MITIYEETCTDFSGNGLGLLAPESCQVSHRLNGNYEVTLVHPLDERGKYTRLREGRILRVPVPAGKTPRMHIAAADAQETEIWSVYTGGDVRLNMRIGPSMDSKVIHAYRPGTEVVIIEKTNEDWWEVTTPDGKRGYMNTYYLRYVRTEETGAAAEEAVLEPKNLRDQPFRIYKIVPTLDNITVYARHIYYDLMDNLTPEYKPKGTETGASVFRGVGGRCETAHDFRFYSDLDSIKEEVELKEGNPAEVIQGSGGVIENYGGELERDWYDVYLAKRVGEDSGVHIRQGKNLTGIKYSVDMTKVVTRIKPKGTDADGKAMYLPEGYIDSPHIGDYVNPKWHVLEVSEAKEVKSGDNKRTKEECYELMREAARKAFDEGADVPDLTLDVSFVNVTEIEEYQQYRHLKSIHMGDTVHVHARRAGVEVALRMTQYAFDCLTRQYNSMTLGTVDATIESNMITAGQIPNGSLGGIKLVTGSVGGGQIASGAIGGGHIADGAVSSGQIADGAVTSLKIALAAIDYAHIGTAAIDQLAVNSMEAIRADIHKLAAGEITTDELYADLAKIAVAQITAANIDKANIQWAEIENLTAAIARIATAEIGTANIDYAKIKDLVTDTAIFTEGVGGKLYVSRLAVTEANMASLTVGELMLKAADGSFVRLVADGEGGVRTEAVQVEGDNIAENTIEGGKLKGETITARELNVSQIFADEALIRAIKAANIDVAELFAAEATIAELNSYLIKASTIKALEGALTLWADERISLGVSGGVDTGTEGGVQVKITKDMFQVDVPGEDGDLTLNEDGGNIPVLRSDKVIAPDVMPRYAGPDAIFVKPDATSQEIEAGWTYRSLKEALAALSGKVVGRQITVYIAHAGTEYGDIRLEGAVLLGGLVVWPDASGRSTVVGSVRVTGCSGHVSMWGVNVTSPAGVNGFHAESPSATIDLSAMKFQGAGSDSGIYVNWGTRLHMYDCQMYDYAYAVNAEHSCQAGLARTVGNCKIRSAWGSVVFVSDSAPDSTGTFSPEETWGGRVFAESGVYVDQGSGGSTPAVPTVSTLSVGVNAAVSYRASGGVWSDDSVIQGWWDGGGRIKGCMWFDNAAIRNALSGKTVLTASLRLHMKTSGRGTQVTVELAGTGANYGGGNPAVTREYGAIATMSPKETATITLPVQAVNDLVSGTINGLMLYSSDTGPHKEREYSKNYAAFTGADGDSSTRPMLTITYEG